MHLNKALMNLRSLSAQGACLLLSGLWAQELARQVQQREGHELSNDGFRGMGLHSGADYRISLRTNVR